MDGAHDLGGREGFGPVEVETDEPVFHEPWEGRTFALAGAVMMAGRMGTPRFRHAIERMDAVHYLTSSYYEHWLTAVASVAVEEGLVGPEDLMARAGGAFPLSRPVAPDVVVDRTVVAGAPPKFADGDRVRVRNVQSKGHTRCPAYVRNRVGTIVRTPPPEHHADLEAHTGELVKVPCYTVRFEATELWNEDAESAAPVHVDLLEPYLEEAP